jgi:hypothetical protein
MQFCQEVSTVSSDYGVRRRTLRMVDANVSNEHKLTAEKKAVFQPKNFIKLEFPPKEYSAY